jgi:hypothetical protein
VNETVTSNLILGVLTKDLCLTYYCLMFEVDAIMLKNVIIERSRRSIISVP